MSHRDKFYNALSKKETECKHLLTDDPRIYRSSNIPITIEKAKPKKHKPKKSEFRDALLDMIKKTISQQPFPTKSSGFSSPRASQKSQNQSRNPVHKRAPTAATKGSTSRPSGTRKKQRTLNTEITLPSQFKKSRAHPPLLYKI